MDKYPLHGLECRQEENRKAWSLFSLIKLAEQGEQKLTIDSSLNNNREREKYSSSTFHITSATFGLIA
jgi:hypothetical protein